MSTNLIPEDAARIVTLVQALGDMHISVGWNACRDLAKMGKSAHSALPALTDKLSSSDANTVLWARFAIAIITQNIKSEMPFFIAALADKKRLFPGMASAALTGLGDHGMEALPELIKELSDEHPDNRWSAAHAIAAIGSPAQSAVPALGKLLHDPDEKVRWYAAHALSEISPESDLIVPELIYGLNDIDDDVRVYCIIALGRMEKLAVSALPDLKAVLGDENPNIVHQAKISIAKILQDSNP